MTDDARGINFDQIDAMRKAPDMWQKAFNNWINRTTGKDGLAVRTRLAAYGLQDRQIHEILTFLYAQEVDKTAAV